MKKLFHSLALVLLAMTLNAQMELVYNTNHINGTTILLPLFGTVNVTIDWDDGSVENITTPGLVEHTYLTEGIYQVEVSGLLTQFGSPSLSYSFNTDALVDVISFGDIGLTSLSYAFLCADNLQSVPVNLPASINDLSNCFTKCSTEISFDNLESWNVSNITDMEKMFFEAHSFNQDIGGWDVGNVTSMSFMFSDVHNFNQDIGDWDVSSVTDMTRLFYMANNFNQDIGGWDVSNVTETGGMFRAAHSFNQDIGGWDVRNVSLMGSMFYFAVNFNQDIGDWDVSNVTSMSSMFFGAYDFNQDIGGWDVSSVINMSSLFRDVINFNQDIGGWDVSNVTDIGGMFGGTDNFNQDIGGWDVSSVIYMYNTFAGADNFNQYIGDWDVSNVTNMGGMFAGANNFNQDIGDWDVSNVTEMNWMFSGADVFNQDISEWCVEQIQNEPEYFSINCPLAEDYKPQWGEVCITSTFKLYSKNIWVYPNPAKNIVHFSSKSGIIVNEINIYNQFGQLMLHKNGLADIIYVTQFAQGIYIIELISGELKIRQKLIIER